MKKLIELKKSSNYNKCIEVARHYFEKYFNHEIRNLTTLFPHDYLDTKGALFWSGPKRYPDFI